MGNPLALIIEDDPNQADIFSISLEHAEFDTEIFQNGGLALARLKKNYSSPRSAGFASTSSLRRGHSKLHSGGGAVQPNPHHTRHSRPGHGRPTS